MGRQESESPPEVRIRIQNQRGKLLTFTLEPWGDQHPMPPGAVFEIVARGPAEGMLELESSDDGLTVYGWSGSIVSVFHDGKALCDHGDGSLPVPPAPPGKSIKGFVGWMDAKTGKHPNPPDSEGPEGSN